MWNAPTKSLLAIFIPLAAAMSVTSCAGGNGNREADETADHAAHALEAGDYTLALSLADSVAHTWPQAIDARRRALHISSRATEGLTLRRLQSTDSLLAVLSVRADSLKGHVRYISNPVEGYYVAAGDDPAAVHSSTGLRGRLSPEGDFYLIATLSPGGAQSTSVTVSDGGMSATTSTVAYDGERNDRSGGMEVITFISAECDSVGRFIYSHAGGPLSLTFNGSGSRTVTLPAESVARIATLYDYALTMRRARMASVEGEKLRRALDLSRAHAAKTYVEPDSTTH